MSDPFSSCLMIRIMSGGGYATGAQTCRTRK